MPSASGKVRIGIIGVGGFANTHMEHFGKLDCCYAGMTHAKAIEAVATDLNKTKSQVTALQSQLQLEKL